MSQEFYIALGVLGTGLIATILPNAQKIINAYGSLFVARLNAQAKNLNKATMRPGLTRDVQHQEVRHQLGRTMTGRLAPKGVIDDAADEFDV